MRVAVCGDCALVDDLKQRNNNDPVHQMQWVLILGVQATKKSFVHLCIMRHAVTEF